MQELLFRYPQSVGILAADQTDATQVVYGIIRYKKNQVFFSLHFLSCFSF